MAKKQQEISLAREIIAQVCHMRMRKINPFLFSAPRIRGIKGDCCIGWVGGEWEVSRRLRQGLGLGLGRRAQG
jgi:hypothetical protein